MLYSDDDNSDDDAPATAARNYYHNLDDDVDDDDLYRYCTLTRKSVSKFLNNSPRVNIITRGHFQSRFKIIFQKHLPHKGSFRSNFSIPRLYRWDLSCILYQESIRVTLTRPWLSEDMYYTYVYPVNESDIHCRLQLKYYKLKFVLRPTFGHFNNPVLFHNIDILR